MRWIVRVARASLVAVAITASAAGAQMDLATSLVGKWEGNVQVEGTRGDAERTLVIESVSQQDGKWVARGRYGITGKALPKVSVGIDVSGSTPTLKFTTGAHAAVRLNLVDQRSLIGTFTWLAASTRGRGARPMKLEKVP